MPKDNVFFRKLQKSIPNEEERKRKYRKKIRYWNMSEIIKLEMISTL